MAKTFLGGQISPYQNFARLYFPGDSSKMDGDSLKTDGDSSMKETENDTD